MGNIIKSDKQNDSSKIIKISSESITPRRTNQSKKIEINIINNINHKKAIIEFEDSMYLQSQKSQISNNNIKNFIYQRHNISNETDKNNHIINTNDTSNPRYNISNQKKYFSRNNYNYKPDDKLYTLVNSNLYEFNFDSSKSLSSSNLNFEKIDKIKNNGKMSHSSVNAVKISKKILTNSITTNKQMRSTDKTIFNDDDYSFNDYVNSNNKKINKNRNSKKNKKHREKNEIDNLDKKLNIDEIFENIRKKAKISNTDSNLETQINLDLIKKSNRKVFNSTMPKKIIKPINGFIYCPTAKNIIKPRNCNIDISSLYSSNKKRKDQNLKNSLIKNKNKNSNNINKVNNNFNISPKNLISKCKNTSEVKKQLIKNSMKNYKLFYRKNFPRKYSKRELNSNFTTSNDTINTFSFNNCFLNESQKKQKMKQLIEKIPDTKLKNEILNLCQSANFYYRKKNSKEDIKINKISPKNSQKLLVKYDKINSRNSSRNMFSLNNMKIVSETNINFYPKNSPKILNFSRNEKISDLANGRPLTTTKKRINSKIVYVNKIIPEFNNKYEFDINLTDTHKSQENKLTIKNFLLSNLIEEKIYYQSDIKKLIDVKYFLINVKKAEYETKIKTHDILCLISDKYFTTLDKSINCKSPKKVLKIKTIKKINIISVGLKKSITSKYVVIIIYYHYIKESQTIKEMQEGLLIEKKKDLNDMINVLSKLIDDLEIIYL